MSIKYYRLNDCVHANRHRELILRQRFFFLSSKFYSFTCFHHTSNISSFLFCLQYVCVEKASLTDSITSYLWIESLKQLKIRLDLGGKEVAAVKQLSSFSFSSTAVSCLLLFWFHQTPKSS